MATPADNGRRGYEACSGCGICTICCPVWWETRDVWFTPHGRARALQGGATPLQLADSVLSCRMCGACEPVCPESIDLMAMVRKLRLDLERAGRNPLTRDPANVAPGTTVAGAIRRGGRVLLGGPALEDRPALMESVVGCLGGADRVQIAADDGRDLAWAFEAGAPLDGARLERWIATLEGAGELIVIDGMLHWLLREQLPRMRVRGFAETLLDEESALDLLGPRDFLVIETRAYHANYEKLVRLFSRLRSRTGCQVNLDLQRVAIPGGADSLQMRGAGREIGRSAIDWMLEGRDIDRIVVESPADLDLLAASAPVPVVPLATLTDDGRGS